MSRKCRDCGEPARTVGVDLCRRHLAAQAAQLIDNAEYLAEQSKTTAGRGLREPNDPPPVDEVIQWGRWERRRRGGAL